MAIEIADPDLEEAVRESLVAAGMGVAEGVANFGIADGSLEDHPLVPEAVQRLMSRLAPEGRLAVVLRRAPEGSEGVEEAWLGGVLHTRHPVCEPLGPAWIVSGARRGLPSGKRKKELRGLGHAMEASVLLGREGLSRHALNALHEALDRHGLVKLKLTPQCTMDKREAAAAAALATGSILVQRVGRSALLLRQGVPCVPPVPRKGRRRG